MKTSLAIRRGSVLKVILFALFCLQAPLAHAQAAGKNRGHIQSVDPKTKTIIVVNKKGPKPVVWSDTVRVKSPEAKDPKDLKPGMWVLCFMNEENEAITIRHNPEEDKPAE